MKSAAFLFANAVMRTELEGQLASERDFTQKIIDAAPVGLNMWDDNFNIIGCNDAIQTIFGIPKQYYIDHFKEFSPEYQNDGVKSVDKVKELQTRVRTGEIIVSEWEHCTATGEPIPCEITMTRVAYNNKQILLVYVYDLRNLKKMEKAVLDAEKTRALIDSVPLSCTLIDKNSNMLSCNESAVEFFKLPGKDDIQRMFVDLMPEYQSDGSNSVRRAEEAIRIAYDDGYLFIPEWTHRSLDGELLPCEVTLVRVEYGGDHIIAGYARDMRAAKEAEAKTREAAEAEAANKAKSSFLATMSHEIRTPMNAILGITEIQLQNKKLLPDTKEALNIIYNSGYSLLGIINDLLDLSKIEAGKLELMDSRYETASLISDTINLNTARIGSKPIQFKLHVEDDLPFELIGDELRVKQILNNLLSNAFKYTDSGEVKLSFSAETAGKKVTLEIIVKDTGQGMTEEQVKSLFDAYSRFNMKANRFVEGTGLGMNIVQHLVNMMGGDISVDSVSGEGTEVTVHLVQGYAGPAKLGSEVVESLKGFRMAGMSKVKKAQVVREYMPYGKVLVVDDMETNLYVAKGFLLPYELKVETALSGIEAIKRIERGDEYDIVFMDHMMPVMDGIETVKQIRGKGYGKPIIALTANAVAGQADMFMANGFDGFISKPIDIRELNAALNKYVRDRQPPEVVEAARAAYGDGVVADTVPQVDPELARIFTNDAEKAMGIIQGYESGGAYEGGDLQMYIINVHALKSALANIGETKLSGMAKELEQAGREKNLAYIADETPVFLRGLRLVVDKLKLGKEEHGGEASEEDLAYMRKMLLTIKEASAGYDIDAAMGALGEIKQKPWPVEYGELLDRISEHLLHSDFDEAEAVCAARLSDM
jgi:PAS domain S-box-containing protein